MNIIDILIINSIFLLIPYLIYFVTITNDNIVEKENENVCLKLAIYASFYLIIMYGKELLIDAPTLLLTIPIIIGYTFNNKDASVVLSIFLIIYLTVVAKFNVIVLIIDFIICYLLNKKIKNKKRYISIHVIIQIVVFICFVYPCKPIICLEVLIIYAVLVRLNIIAISYINRLSEFSSTVKEMETNKQVKRSLFKISHEIKNPLAVCKGYFELIDGSLDKYKRYMPIIKDEIDHSLLILDDFRTIGKLNYEFETMDIVCLLDEVVTNYKNILAFRNITLFYEFTDDEVLITGDYIRLKQVLINVIKNAIEACSNKKKAKIDVIKYIDEDDFVIEIIDNGSGISKDNINRIGQAFFTTKEQGTGLGIYYSKEVLEAHHGSINYYSSTKKGTTVQIRIKK